MSFTEPSFQTLLEPYQNLVSFRFRAKLQQCKQHLIHLNQEVPVFMPAASEWISMANALLDRINPELQRMDFQLLTILQIQLRHSLEPSAKLGRRLGPKHRLTGAYPIRSSAMPLNKTANPPESKRKRECRVLEFVNHGICQLLWDHQSV